MSGTVTKLREVNAEPDADTVEALEHALELARSGELRSVVIVGEMTGNAIYSRVQVPDRLTALGALHHALYRLHRSGDV